MKAPLAMILIGLAGMTLTSSAAFDAAAWNGKRRRLGAEILRLQAAYTNCVAQIQVPAEDVSLSVETYPDGSVKTLIAAKRAQFFLDTGLIWAEGVTLKKLKEDGSQDVLIEAGSCVLDRETKTGWAEGPAKVIQDKTAFSGKGVFFSSPDRYIRVFDAVDMETRNLKTGGLRP